MSMVRKRNMRDLFLCRVNSKKLRMHRNRDHENDPRDTSTATAILNQTRRRAKVHQQLGKTSIGRRLAPEQNNADIANRPHTRERRKRKTRATYSPGDDAAHDAQRSVDEPTPTFVMLC